MANRTFEQLKIPNRTSAAIRQDALAATDDPLLTALTDENGLRAFHAAGRSLAMATSISQKSEDAILKILGLEPLGKKQDVEVDPITGEPVAPAEPPAATETTADQTPAPPADPPPADPPPTETPTDPPPTDPTPAPPAEPPPTETPTDPPPADPTPDDPKAKTEETAAVPTETHEVGFTFPVGPLTNGYERDQAKAGRLIFSQPRATVQIVREGSVEGLLAIREGLKAEGATLESGRPVKTNEDTLAWILQQF